MIVVDTSAIIALLLGEAEAAQYANLLADAPDVRMSAVTDYEARVVLRPRGPAMIFRYDALLAEIGVSIVPFDQEQARLAFEGYRHWGKGVHPAALNLGDCAAYALAKTLDAPLLFKGADFARTDVRRAL
ncbi:MAG TPA: type II toxin-antitoxin system VapC family toxin [Reyranella sp.]|nr:type II toxin-antitoxin system VapC family toxin [Reyranella sp.]HTE81710.1 type II toxin-antitoxin system VapC family toxin [Reyranella sp.]